MDTINKDILAQNIITARSLLSMSQRQFAVLMDVSQATILSYENAERVPSLEFVLKLAHVTNKPVEALCLGVVNAASIESEVTRAIKKKLISINGDITNLINSL